MSELSDLAMQVLAFFGRRVDAVHDSRRIEMKALIDAGLVERSGQFLGYGVYRITDAGRAKLTEQEATMNVPLRDHGFYWVKHPDSPQTKVIAEWCHLAAVGRHVWFLPGDEDYRYDDAITVISGRLHEPGSSLLSRMRDVIGKRDPARNVVWR